MKKIEINKTLNIELKFLQTQYIVFVSTKIKKCQVFY